MKTNKVGISAGLFRSESNRLLQTAQLHIPVLDRIIRLY
jgi:hypothetical protein